MAAYLVYFDPQMPVGARNGVKAAVVYAADEADAKALLKALYSDDLDASWANASAVAINAGTDLNGWTLRVQVITPEGVVLADVNATGDGTNNTMDEIAALIVTALNATDDIAGAAYNSSTNTLKVAETTDNIGDHRVIVFFYPPGQTTQVKKDFPGLVGTITDEGNANAALTVVLGADAYSLPALTAKFAATD